MTADDLLQLITQTVFFAVFVAVGIRAVRRPLRANVDTALLFGDLGLIVAAQWVTQLLALGPLPALDVVTAALLMALPYLHLRLLDDLAGVRAGLLRAAEVGLALSVVGVAAYVPRGARPPLWLIVALVAYFATVELYATIRFWQESRRPGGVTRRRMQSVAAGSGLLAGVLLLALPPLALPQLAAVWMVLSRCCGLGSGVAYALGFAPPSWLRRAWQEPELRAFLTRASNLPRLPDTGAIVAALEAGAAASIGTPGASIGLWDEDRQMLHFPFRSPEPLRQITGQPDQPYEADGFDVSGDDFLLRPGCTIAGRAFAAREAIFAPDAARQDPANAGFYATYGVRAEMVAPIVAGQRALGVLVVWAGRAPIFAEEDLTLVQLLADQAAVILESRALIDEAARIRALEHATRLKDDFLSAAAHDLKTPLTTLVAQAQLLERRARRDPAAPADTAGIARLAREARRLSALVMELLDASRAERGLLVGQRQPLDLVEAARESCARQPAGRCRLEADGALVGQFDRVRIGQLLDNLIENGVKYSPSGEPVLVRVWREGDEARLSVADRGIGIPARDVPHIFDRFYRAGNVDDRRFAGMGLGLYICRGIAEQHGGRIWVESTPAVERNGERVGGGSTFHVGLPLVAGGPAA